MNPILKEFDWKTRVLFVMFTTIVRALNLTYRKKIFGSENRVSAVSAHDKGSFAFATWHGNSFAGTIVHGFQKFAPLCSRSKDGSMVAYLCDKLGLRPVRGSSSRGGKEARLELLEAIEKGFAAAITVDGPTGPPFVTKAGIISIAKESGVQIIPLAAISEKFWQLRSWDRLKIPKPFSRLAVVYGTPIEVPKNVQGEDFEALQQKVTETLTNLENSYLSVYEKWDQGTSVKEFR